MNDEHPFANIMSFYEDVYKLTRERNSILYNTMAIISFGWPIIIYYFDPNKTIAPLVGLFGALWLIISFLPLLRITIDTAEMINRRLRNPTQKKLSDYE